MTAHVRVVEATEYEAYIEGLADDLAEAQEAVRDEVAAAAARPSRGRGGAVSPPPTATEARPELVVREGVAPTRPDWV